MQIAHLPLPGHNSHSGTSVFYVLDFTEGRKKARYFKPVKWTTIHRGDAAIPWLCPYPSGARTRVASNPRAPWLASAPRHSSNSSSVSPYFAIASSACSTPAFTALTTAAFRLATQRDVSSGGKLARNLSAREVAGSCIVIISGLTRWSLSRNNAAGHLTLSEQTAPIAFQPNTLRLGPCHEVR